MITFKASAVGRVQIKQARLERGWPVNDFRWIEAASGVLGTDWNSTGMLAAGVSEGTWKRFLAGKVAINANAFKAYCEVLGLRWQAVIESPTESRQGTVSTGASSAMTDWGSAPDDTAFYGRQGELKTLTRWIVADRCHLVTLLGLGGIGKTALSVHLAKEIIAGRSFDRLIWRSLRNTPPPEDTLADLIQVLSNQQAQDLPERLEGRLARLLHYLRDYRCLVVLDNAESILQSGDRTGRYRAGYERYGELLRCVAQTGHQSCVIVTSREKPKGLAAYEGDNLPVRSLQLAGLPSTDSRALFDAKGGFQATESDWQALSERYSGNPLALKIVASSVRDFFGGDISQFLSVSQQGGFLFDDIRDLLTQHFRRLTALEKGVMYWLAINREPCTIADLQSDLLAYASPSDLWESLNSLQRRSLIERNNDKMTQQPVVMEYVASTLIESVSDEIVQRSPDLFISHALIKAQSRDYLRDAQINLILKPLVQQLLTCLGTAEQITTNLKQLLAALRDSPPKSMGYAGGNSLNLLLQLPIDISGYDFSKLTVWQAYLQDVKLQGVNFTGADLSHCVFTESLGNVLSAAFSPDGRYLATGDTDCQVRVWDSQTSQLRLICCGHENWVRAVALLHQY